MLWPSDLAPGKDKIDERHDGQEANEADDDDDFRQEVVPPPTRDAFVPNGCQELLTMWVSHELKVCLGVRLLFLKWSSLLTLFYSQLLWNIID